MPARAASISMSTSSTTLHARAGRLRRPDALQHERRGLARRAPAEVRVLADDELIERGGRDLAELAHVLVAPVAGDADDADGAPGPAPLPLRHRPHHPAARRVDQGQVHELRQAAHAVHVVAVVDDDLEAADVELVEAAGRLEEGRGEGAQALADVVEVRAVRPRGGGRGERVGHVHAGAAIERGGDEVGVDERHRSRLPWRRASSSPSSVSWTIIAAPPRPQWVSTRSQPSLPFSVAIEK